MPFEDVRAARVHRDLCRRHPTVGEVLDPIELISTTDRERRHCRSCGFPAGDDELLLRFAYEWPSEGLWEEGSSAVVIHVADCRHGAAHDMVVTGVRHAIAGSDLDEVERAILALRVNGLSDRQIAETVGTTDGSVTTLLRRTMNRLKFRGDRHARSALAALHEAAGESTSIAHRMDAMIDELLR